MTTKQTTVDSILLDKEKNPKQNKGNAFAPSNIALCKYWGKRDQILNLPNNSSLSISLANKGATAIITPIDAQHNKLIVNGAPLDKESKASKRLNDYLDLFRFEKKYAYQLELNVNIPFAAGLASSACIFASIAKSINQLYHWQLSDKTLSILARLGSGSASRSIAHGFVEWEKGVQADGMDSFATLIPEQWTELCIGLCLIDTQKKKTSSREGMQRTIETSPLYPSWPNSAENDIKKIRQAITEKDFNLLGKTAENNALAMHATMLAAWPPLLYSNEKTISLMRQVWALREQGQEIYFTQDAGPNLKLLFLEKDSDFIKDHFIDATLVKPFQREHSNEQRK